MDREGGALLISTPRGSNYFHKAFQRGQDPQDPRVGLLAVPSWTNIHLPEGEIEDAQGPPGRPVRAGGRGEVHRRGLQHLHHPEPDHPAAGEAERSRGAGDRPRQDRRLHGHLRGERATRRNCYFERFQDVTWPRQRRIIKVCNDLSTPRGHWDHADGRRHRPRRPGGGRAGGAGLRRHRPELHHVQGQDGAPAGEGHGGRQGVHRRRLRGRVRVPTRSRRRRRAASPTARPRAIHDDVVSAKMLQHWGIVMEGTPRFT